MSKSKFLAKGRIIFFISEDGTYSRVFDKDYYAKEYEVYGDTGKLMLDDKYEREFTLDIYDLIDGKEFLECVKCGGFTNYDGHIAQVFVDNFVSNIGLLHDNFIGGNEFYLDEKTWLNVCNEYNILVNWVNK